MPKTRQKRPFYGWYMVAAAWVMSFLVPATALGLFFKPLLDEFGISRTQLSLVSSISLLVFAVLSPFLGRLIDRFGPRRLLLAVTSAQVLSSLSCALAQGLPALYFGRLLYELKPTHGTQVLVNRWFVRQRGRALGILSSGVPLGQLVLSPVTQYLITTLDWRNTFYFWAGTTVLLVLPLFMLVKDQPEEKGLRPDGADLTMDTPQQKSRVSAGMTIKAALRQRSFWLLAATHIICGVTCGLMATHVVILAVDLGYSALTGAGFLSVQGGVSLLGVLVTGILSDRMARRSVLSLTHLMRSLGLWVLVLPLLCGMNNLVVLYAAMVIFGFGWYTTAPLAAGISADLFGHLRMGTLLGIILSSHMIGMAIGSFAGGLNYQLCGSYQAILVITASLELLAAFLAFIIRPPLKT